MDKKNLIEFDFQIEKYNTPSFSLNTYFITSDEDAALVDPIFDPVLYDQLLEETSTTLKYIFFTHVPINFISDYEDLAQKTEAKIVFGPGAPYEHKDGSVFDLGRVKIKLIATPGFTKEAVCYVVVNSKGTEKAVMTGPSLLLGDVGHALVKEEEKKNEMASEMYESIEKMKQIDKEVLVFPGFGQESICGGSVLEGHSAHLEELIEKTACMKMEKEEFVKYVIEKSQKYPKIYDKIKRDNCKEKLSDVFNGIKKISPDEIKKLIADDKELFIIDTRDQSVSALGYIKSSLVFSLKVGFVKFFQCLMNQKNKFIFITDKDKQNDSLLLAMRLGNLNLVGYSDYESWKEKGNEVETILYEPSTTENVNKLVKNGEYILDIREVPEFRSVGVVKDAHLSPLSTFGEKYAEVPKDKTIHIMCKSGARAAIALSYLKRMGYENKMIILQGSCVKLQSENYQFEKYEA